MILLDLPIDISINAQVRGPWKICHTFLDCISISLIIMPHFSLHGWRWRDFDINLTMNNLMMTFGVK